MNAPFVFQLGGWLKIEATKYGIIHVIGGLQEVAITKHIHQYYCIVRNFRKGKIYGNPWDEPLKQNLCTRRTPEIYYWKLSHLKLKHFSLTIPYYTKYQ